MYKEGDWASYVALIAMVAVMGLLVYCCAHPPEDYEPPIKRRQAYKMIQEIHEVLIKEGK